MPTYKDKEELLHSQTNADETNKENSSTELVERKPIPGTPFWMIREQEKYWVTLGQYRLNQTPLDSENDVEEFLLTNSYNIMLQMIYIHSQIIKNVNPKPNGTQSNTGRRTARSR